MLRDGRGGKVDYDGAIALYEAGIAGGDGTAMDAMGWLYLNGIGVQADDVEARRYYQMASDAGYAQGTGNLAFMTEMGAAGPRISSWHDSFTCKPSKAGMCIARLTWPG